MDDADGAPPADSPKPVGAPAPPGAPTATRRSLQLGRRLFHLANGVAMGTAYAVLFTHTQVVRIFGAIACLAYVADRVRIHYPELVDRLPGVNAAFFRAEERVRESAMIPYAIAILLTILTFPKPIALIAIYTLAIADPASAIVGIRFGRRRIAEGRTLEGSAAFFAATLAVSWAVLAAQTGAAARARLGAATAIALAATLFEMVPLRIDDNLTIPLLVGFAGWAACRLAGIPLG